MKSLKTYNMDQDCIQILNRQPNKSKYVCDAIRAKHTKMREAYASDFPTNALMIALKERDIPEHIKREIINYLFESLQSNS